MRDFQARGYIFEKVIWDLLGGAGYIDVKPGNLNGRGASHQIDAYGTLEIPTAFTYPIRLIAEAKCYKRTIDLGIVRNFFGVIQDISENYVIGENKERNTPNRYLDSGCIFSVSPFSPEAQNYAWAHNIFLVSFSGIPRMNRIYQNIKQFVSEIDSDILKEIKKEELIAKFDFFKSTDDTYTAPPTLVVGILDNAYPVMLVGNNGWIKRIKPPKNTDNILGVKINRKSRPDETIFNLHLNGEIVSFNLPNAIAKKLIERIDKTDYGEKVFGLDIPLKYAFSESSVRRILKVDINLPNNQDYVNTISPQNKNSENTTR
ncbi:restriction endonuclease [Methanocalculus sp.]|uniref:restriction endonuclease n=1 Tax=Methanocalculus sp. TaxID=2004547 RepID=UPI002618E4B0|nr:restriction endonuclease [Methanocalculus sp.]MDG6251397.1 restriction endonuclease [Methanocalculus sp.]